MKVINWKAPLVVVGTPSRSTNKKGAKANPTHWWNIFVLTFSPQYNIYIDKVPLNFRGGNMMWHYCLIFSSFHKRGPSTKIFTYLLIYIRVKKVKNQYTVFPYIVAAATILFWNCKTLKISNSFRIMFSLIVIRIWIVSSLGSKRPNCKSNIKKTLSY